MTDAGEQSLNRLEKNAERTRADLTQTVDELRSRISDTATDLRAKVSPAAIKQEVKDYVQSTSQNLLHTLERKARENPLQAFAVAAGLAYPLWRIVSKMPAPILLIGAGIALANKSEDGHVAGMLQSGRAAAEKVKDAVSERVESTTSAVREALSNVGDKVSETAGTVGSAISSAVDSVTSGIGEPMRAAADYVERAATGGVEAVSQGVSSSFKTGAELSSSVQQQARRAGENVQATFAEVMERHPLVVGGLGLALGALIASALPSTKPEQRLFGDTSDELHRQARGLASRGVESAQTVVKEVYEAATQDAKEKGLGPDGLREAAEDLNKKVKSIADRAATVVTSAIKPESNT